jgi:hypothetical protein
MEKIKNCFMYCAFMLFIGSMVGCKKNLEIDPVGVQTLDVTFSDFSGALAATNGIYSRLSTSNLYRGNISLLLVDQASDDVIYGPRATPNYSKIDYFENASTDIFVMDIWSAFYEIIYRSNVVIGRVPNVPIPPARSLNSAGLPFKDQLIGEAKFLRAFSYFNLVRLFGDVPVHISEISSIEEINIPRTKVAEVYKQIESDLQDAVAKLPPTYSGSGVGNEKGRVTKWAAMALLAEVYLTQKNYTGARDMAAQIINGSLVSGFRLNDTYVGNYIARGGVENSPESLFEIQFGGATISGPGASGQNYSSLMSGANNVPRGISTYKPSDNSLLENEPGYTGSLVQAYDIDNDLRFKLCYYRDIGFGSTITWHCNKWYILGQGSGNENFIVSRLADVYLMYAEAVNEIGGPDAISVEYVNKLRRRAFGSPVNTPSVSQDIVLAGLTQIRFRDLIREERRKELAFENKRWFDLLRYGYDYMVDVLVNKQKRVLFKKDFMLFPIPATELVANPQMTQNLGYK